MTYAHSSLLFAVCLRLFIFSSRKSFCSSSSDLSLIFTPFSAQFPYFEKNESRLMRSPCCLCIRLCLFISVCMSLILLACEITFLSVCLSVYLPNFCGRLMKSSCCLCALPLISFSMPSVSYQRKFGDYFTELIVPSGFQKCP
jgi:hypothetical protein